MPIIKDISAETPNRVSARLGIVLAAFLPIVAVTLTTLYQNQNKPTESAENYSNYGGDRRLLKFCAENLKNDRSFVLFQHGTCVVVEGDDDAATIKEQAVRLLHETASPDARFICTPVENNNMIVSYTEPVFHLRFSEDIDKHRHEIETDFRRFLTEKEIADISPNWNPPFHAKVGLRSRARLLKDASNPVVSHIVAPHGTEKTSTEHTASVSF